MAKTKTLANFIQETESNLEKFKFVQSKYPDATYKIGPHGIIEFMSKTVNSTYTDLHFLKYRSHAIYVAPFSNIEFTNNGKDEVIRVYASPRRSRLAYMSWYNKTIKFSRIAVNLKNNNFSDSMLQDCYVQIANFIKENPSYKLDTKHLAPKLKKILSFI